MERARPTIKGIFVNSHIKAVERLKGTEGLQRLARCYGKPVQFRNSDDIPIREEVAILECALDILRAPPVPASQRSFEAGKLHFKNFTTTPLARIIFTVFRPNLKLMLMQAQNIAGHVFQGVRFTSSELAPRSVKIVMENNDYPIDHFRGLFSQWVSFSGFTGRVDSREIAPGTFEYIITWD